MQNNAQVQEELHGLGGPTLDSPTTKGRCPWQIVANWRVARSEKSS